MSYGANPYILFLILILLVIGNDPEAGNKMEVFKNIVVRMTSAVNNFRTGINSMTADFEEINVMLRNLNAPAKGDPE